MNKGKLYLVCPECYIEKAIRNEFGPDVYFLTALGTVFDLLNVNYTDALAHFITREMIAEITIVNDPACTFITNVIAQEEPHTSAEHTLKKLYANNSEKFALLGAKKTENASG